MDKKKRIWLDKILVIGMLAIIIWLAVGEDSRWWMFFLGMWAGLVITDLMSRWFDRNE